MIAFICYNNNCVILVFFFQLTGINNILHKFIKTEFKILKLLQTYTSIRKKYFLPKYGCPYEEKKIYMYIIIKTPLFKKKKTEIMYDKNVKTVSKSIAHSV